MPKKGITQDKNIDLGTTPQMRPDEWNMGTLENRFEFNFPRLLDLEIFQGSPHETDYKAL